VLEELRVENLLLMERAELRLGPGLNVLTGETGAGKTLLAHALDLLLGGKARSGIVRAGASEAYVEGVFGVPEWLRGDERIPEDCEELVLARRVWPDGRTRAYVCGRSATVADLKEIGTRLLSFYGQHEHRKLMVTATQLEALDSFCGAEVIDLLVEMRSAHQHARALETRLAEVADASGARERELDLLAFELAEIDEVAPTVAEEQELLADRERLRHAEALRTAAAGAADALSPDEGSGALALLAEAAGAVGDVAPFDPELEPLASRLTALRYEAEDIAGELRGYLGGRELDSAQRLEDVEQRLAAYSRLTRKHGGTVEEVLAHAERCRVRHAELLDSTVTVEGLTAELASARAQRESIGAALHDARVQAAPRLAAAVLERLAELAMGDARFEVEVSEREGGYGMRGRDAVEFVISPNPGMPLGPLREIASGGEMSRVMLALLSVAHAEDCGSEESGGSLLVFDEIDAGIGGHTARAVGTHLRSLAAGRQLLCITHLPQVAALAERHFTIVKDGSQSPAITTVSSLNGDGVLGELVRMLGADVDDRAARGHAKELLRAA
jgi:DNA repair protein RecN (Recombination protein N)